MTTLGEERAAAVHDELRAKIRTVIERVGVTDMAVDIIIDLVARGLGKLGGRPPNGIGSRFKRDTKPTIRASGDLFSDPSSLLPENPDPSKPDQEKVGNIMGETGALVPTPFFKALRQFCEVWRTKYVASYEPDKADKNQLGRLVKQLTPELLADLPRAFRNYLDDFSPFVAQEQRHNLRYFCTSGGFNKYRVNAPVLSAREARGMEAGRQFVNGEGTHAGKR